MPQVATAPVNLKARATSCDAVSLSWEAPLRHTSPALEHYEISAVANSGPANDRLILRVHGLSISFLASGLRAGTQYSFMVAAKNVVGRGGWSEPARATTLPATDKPPAPTAALQPAASMDTCDSVALRAASMRPGCAPDEAFVLEMAMAGGRQLHWRTVTAATRHGLLVASGLDPKTAYLFRSRARNAIGLSEPGPASLPLLPGGMADTLRKAPRVEAISSSAYRVAWGADTVGAERTSCDIQIQWRLEYNRAANGAKTWQALFDRTPLTHFEPQLRCPEGCRFRVFALNVNGWSEPSASSELLSTRQLHPPTHGAARLELLIRPSTPLSNSLPAQFEREVAAALEVPQSRVHCVEVRRQAMGRPHAIVFDVQPASHAHLSVPQNDGGLWSEADEQTLILAQTLAIQLLAPGSTLRQGPLLSQVDADAGLMQLDEYGNVAQIGAWVPPPASPLAPGDFPSEGFPLLQGLAVAAVVLYYLATRNSRKPRGYEKVAVSQLDGDVCDVPNHGSIGDAFSESGQVRVGATRVRVGATRTESPVAPARAHPVPAALPLLPPSTSASAALLPSTIVPLPSPPLFEPSDDIFQLAEARQPTGVQLPFGQREERRGARRGAGRQSSGSAPRHAPRRPNTREHQEEERELFDSERPLI